MKALVLGRFQPLHLGHLSIVQGLDNLNLDEILLGIGTTNAGRTQKNPFTFDEVKGMWETQLNKIKTKVSIYQIPDINNPPKYARHVGAITGADENSTFVVSNNNYTIDCFTNYDSSYKIHRPDKIMEGQDLLCATKIRESMRRNLTWQQYVPKGVAKFLEKINAQQMIQNMGEIYGQSRQQYNRLHI